MISIGPEIVGLHAPGEKVRISSTERCLPAARRARRRPLELAPAAAAPPERLAVEDRGPTTGKGDGAELLLLAQHAVHGRPGRAGHRGDVLLGQGHDPVVVDPGELDETAPDTRLRIDVVGLDEPVGRTPQLLPRGGAGGRPSHPGAPAAAERSRLGTPSGSRRPRALPRSRSGARRARAARARRSSGRARGRRSGRRRPSGVEDARAEAAANDEVQRVGRVLAVKDDLTPRERAPTSDREQLPNVLGREIGEQRPVHDVGSLCNRGDIRNVARANDTTACGS